MIESKIGSGTTVSGTLKFQGLARIEGVAESEISGEDVEIAEGAVVNARVSAVRVTVGGNLAGEVFARERVEMLATARVQCTINTPELVIREGAIFDGDCQMARHRVT